jgi:Mg2+/Co2+ transporter CorB
MNTRYLETPSLNDVSISTLFIILVLLLLLSAFFSGTETALTSLNRYRLRHAAQLGNRGARLAEKLLERPDRLIGLILVGNNLVNISASSLVTLIALRVGGEAAIAAAVGLFTLVILIFAEVTPKTLAALKPERIALPAAFIYYPLLKITYPLVWVINMLALGILRLFGVRMDRGNGHSLSREELRTVLVEAGAMVPQRHKQMLLSVLDLERVTVDDIMVPRNEVVGIDLSDDWSEILEQLRQSQHTRMPVYEGELDNIVGTLHLKYVARELARGQLDRERLLELARERETYFVPEGTPLNTQLLNFQRQKRRVALVVDEYGDVQGLVTLEDILEEIVGEFTTDPATMMHNDVHSTGDGSFVVNASATLRALNRAMHWTLPTDGPKTLNGLIIEQLENIPEPGVGLKIDGYAVEVLQTGDNAIKTVRVRPPGAIAGEAVG